MPLMIDRGLETDIATAMAVLPEDTWDVQDDNCDCTYPRIGFWTNPYVAETLEVRMCCIWARIYKAYPQFVRTTKAYWSDNEHDWVREPAEWNGEDDMPAGLWYRQLARQQGRSVAEIRAEYASRLHEKPKGVPRPPQPQVEPEPSMLDALLSIVMHMADRLDALEAKP